MSRAIHARGGSLPTFTRESTATVHEGISGSWQWSISLLGPATLRVTLVTSGEDQHWVTDGEEARTYLGTGLVTREPLAQSELGSLARWIELIHLDALADSSRFIWAELSSPAPSKNATRGLTVRCVENDCGTYQLFFDEGLRLVAAEGPLTIPALGTAAVHARFHDYRTVDGLELPFAADYAKGGAPLLEERITDFRTEPD